MTKPKLNRTERIVVTVVVIWTIGVWLYVMFSILQAGMQS